MTSLVQRSPEWYELLKHTLGGSDVATILGLNPYQTPLELYNEIKGISPARFKTAAMERGASLEDEARAWYMARTGFNMVQPNTITHPEHPYLRVSLDGIDFMGERAVEIKSPGEKKLKEIKENGVPKEYYAQVQYQYWFNPNIKNIDLWVYQGEFKVFDEPGMLFDIDRDQEFIESMMLKVFEFYTCLVNNIPPEGSKSKTEYEDADFEEWLALVQPLREVRARLKRDSELEESLVKEIKELANGTNLKGFGMSIMHVPTKGSVDYTKIPELKGVDLEQYRKKETVRVTIKVD